MKRHTIRLLFLFACACCAAACGSPSNDDPQMGSCAPKTETSTYTYDTQGQIAKIERRAMDQKLETKTYTDGKISAYTLLSADGATLVSAAWTYTEHLDKITVDDNRDSTKTDWSISFAYDDQGNITRATLQGTLTDAIAQRLGSNESTEALFLGTGPWLIDGLDLKQAEAVQRVPLTNAVVNLTYDAGQFTQSTWDYDGDGQIDATRRDRHDPTSHSTDLFFDPLAEIVAATINRQFDAQGSPTTTTAQILVGLDSHGNWSTNPLQTPLVSTKTWERAPISAPSDDGATYEIRERLSLLNAEPYIARLRRYDAQDRVVADFDFDDKHAITDQTRITYDGQDRTEYRDRDVNNALDQTTTYHYDAADGRLLDVRIDEVDGACDPGLGAW